MLPLIEIPDMALSVALKWRVQALAVDHVRTPEELIFSRHCDIQSTLQTSRTEHHGIVGQKCCRIFNAIRDHGKQSLRSLAERIGLSKSSVHRHRQAMDRRDRYPESSLWETEAGRAWLIRLVVAATRT